MSPTPWTRRLGWLAAGMLCVGPVRSSFADGLDWKLSTSLNYESGDFGTGVRSSSLYIPFTARLGWGDLNASLTLPYLRQSGDGQVRNVGGRSARARKGPSTAAVTRSGPGDLLIRGGYVHMREDPQVCDLELVGELKLPTGDKDKGLGTGEFDEGLGLEFGKLIVPAWTLLAGLYYTFIGAPPGTKLNDRVAVDVGFTHPIKMDLTSTVLLRGSNALVSGEPAPLELRGIIDYKLGGQSSLLSGVLVGLSNGSPDYGLSLGASHRF